MKLPFNFSKSEQTLLKKVVVFSASVSMLVVLLVWGIRYTLVQQNSHQKSRPIETASRLYEKSSKDLLPIDIETHQWAARHLLETGQPDKAVEHLLRILPRQKENRTYLLLLARAYLESGRYNDAYALLENLQFDDDPEREDEIRSMTGMCLFYLNDIESARKVLFEHLKKVGRSARTACYLGQIQAAIATPSDSAEMFFLKAIDWQPDYAEAWYQLARYYMNCQQYQKSRAYLLHVLELEPLHARAHSRLGMAYYYLKQYDLAKTAYETALALNPNDYNTRYNLGELYFSLYEHYHEQAAGYTENSKTVSDTLDAEKEANRAFASALQSFEKTLDIQPTHSQALYKTGLLYLTANNPGKAEVFLARAADLEPTNTKILLQLAVARERLNDDAGALEIYRRIASYDIMNPIARQKIEMFTTLEKTH